MRRRITQTDTERGAALILAFLAILVLVVVMGEVTVKSSVERSTAFYSLREVEYEYAARGGLEVAKSLLIKDLKDEQSQSEGGAGAEGPSADPGATSMEAGEQEEAPADSMQDEWANDEQTGQQFGDGIELKIRVIDEDRKFNILSLAAEEEEFRDAAHDQFVRLLDTFREDSRNDLSEGDAADLAERFEEWMTGERDREFPVPRQTTSEEDEGDEGGAVFGKSRFQQEEEYVVNFPLSLDELVYVEGMTESILRGYMEDGRYVPGLEDVCTVYSNLRFDEDALEEDEEGDGSEFDKPQDSGFGGDEGEDEPESGEDDPDMTGEDDKVATETFQGRLNINTTPLPVLRSIMDSQRMPYSVLEKIDEFRHEMFDEDYLAQSLGLDEEDDGSKFGSDRNDRGSGGDEGDESPWGDEEEDFIFRNPMEIFARVEEYYGTDFGLEEELKQEFANRLAVKSNVFTILIELRSNKSGTSVSFDDGEAGPPDRLYRAVVWRRTGGDSGFQCVTLVPLHPWAGVVPPGSQDYKDEYPFGF